MNKENLEIKVNAAKTKGEGDTLILSEINKSLEFTDQYIREEHFKAIQEIFKVLVDYKYDISSPEDVIEECKQLLKYRPAIEVI